MITEDERARGIWFNLNCFLLKYLKNNIQVMFC